MRVFRLADGSSWTARLEDAAPEGTGPRSAWEAILFESDPATVAQRLVYRPAGWLASASPAELAAALAEGVVIRARWGRTG